MKKLTVLLLFVFSLLLSSNAQTKSKDIELIKDNPEYYWGMSQVVESQDEAMNASLQSLYSNIANKCNADAIFATNLDPMLFLENIIKTFDNKIQQKIVEQIPLVEDFEDDQYSYFVYIKRSDFEAMCDERKKSIERLALRGYNCENDDNLQIEDALRNYYWGLMLCVAHPHGNSITLKIDDEEVNAYNWLIDRIGGSDGVLNSFTFRLPKEAEIEDTPEGLLLCLNVRSTTGMPVMNLQFDYYNGQKYIPAYVNDGKSNIIIRPDRDVISIRIEYQFKTESTVDPDVYKVLHNLNHNIKFDNKLIVNIENIKKEYENRIASIEEQPAIEDSVAVEEDVLLEEEVDIVKKEWRKIDNKFDLKDPDYMQIMKDVENAIRSKNYLSVKHHFTDEGYGMLDTLSRYGKMTIIGNQEYNFLKFGNQVICRDINMQFDFRNTATFNRDVVFRFDSETKKITSLAFRLSSIAENDILSKSKWSEEARLMLINFLEDYQTAYALKRHDYLQSIYSDDALIIVGHIVKKTVIPDRAQFEFTDDDVRLMQYDKETYFNNLLKTFNTQEYINIKFEDTEFTRAKTSTDRDVYGVRLLQRYYSATYGDIGYLFLLVDLTDENPLIHVRAWQPNEVELDKLMGMKDLKM